MPLAIVTITNYLRNLAHSTSDNPRENLKLAALTQQQSQMTKFHRLKFENRNSYQFHLQFYKNACQTIKEAVLQLDWGWATPTYMKFYCWNSYIKIRGQPSSNLNSSGLTRNRTFHSEDHHAVTVRGVSWPSVMKIHQMPLNYLLAKHRN